MSDVSQLRKEVIMLVLDMPGRIIPSPELFRHLQALKEEYTCL